MCSASGADSSANVNQAAVGSGAYTGSGATSTAAAGSSHVVASTASDDDTAKQIQDEVKSILASEPTQAPDVADARTHLAADAQARSILAQRGRSSTFVGGMSLTGSGPQAVKSILGG